jgi:hypothetical protein
MNGDGARGTVSMRGPKSVPVIRSAIRNARAHQSRRNGPVSSVLGRLTGSFCHSAREPSCRFRVADCTSIVARRCLIVLTPAVEFELRSPHSHSQLLSSLKAHYTAKMALSGPAEAVHESRRGFGIVDSPRIPGKRRDMRRQIGVESAGSGTYVRMKGTCSETGLDLRCRHEQRR